VQNATAGLPHRWHREFLAYNNAIKQSGKALRPSIRKETANARIRNCPKRDTLT